MQNVFGARKLESAKIKGARKKLVLEGTRKLEARKLMARKLKGCEN
jgi:hypothetical protein